MSDNFRVEVFRQDFSFCSYALVAEQKYEFDYMSLGNNDLKIPGNLKANKKDYILIRYGEHILQGIVTGIEHQKLETRIKYKSLLSIFDADVYKKRSDLSKMTAEQFIGSMIQENFVSNEDSVQNIPGLTVEYESETEGATLNLKDDIHNIYDLAINVFRKYGIVVEMNLDIMGKKLRCRIGKKGQEIRTVEADLKNVLETKITIKEDDESVNKVIVYGEHGDEEDPDFGKTEKRIYYLDKQSGNTTMTPTERVTPVVFRAKVISYEAGSFEEDAYETAYDMIYREECDNSIKVKLSKDDPLHHIWDFEIGKPCVIIKNGVKYRTIFTGYSMDKTVTLLFGMVRTEYTKKIKRRFA